MIQIILLLFVSWEMVLGKVIRVDKKPVRLYNIAIGCIKYGY
ncbi:hypothetical protein SAMN02745118_00375 [Selenihalanaerobacter shriftii]|uniref:Uncharacterized protein n=1 Tax=Selenihalanaerobacter shriftii TaxID=142842 RepID=A0A1T4JSP5_9FIRM|nr:hypothetical protein SAMN02745118_00375 [Selenihalanaerobacter shriftii]